MVSVRVSLNLKRSYKFFLKKQWQLVKIASHWS